MYFCIQISASVFTSTMYNVNCNITSRYSIGSHFDFGFIWSFIGVWHFGPLFLSLSVRLHHATKKGTFVLKQKKIIKMSSLRQLLIICSTQKRLLCKNPVTIKSYKCNHSLHHLTEKKKSCVLQYDTPPIQHAYLNMWEVAVLELQEDLQSTFLVEFFQSLNRSII